ncbi:MAG: site-2 protease family protein [Chloroflexi bacterium]|nr:site-2 protease family protein [Chloroflexota bacterium]
MFNLNLATLISRAVILVIAFTVHEFAHAWTADVFDDDTPRSQGRLTLNPLKHLDPIGTLLLLFAGFGWARPVQVNTYNLERRSPAAPMLVALAGPFSNLLLAIMVAIPVQFGVFQLTLEQGVLFPTLSQFIIEFVFINLILMLFNLLPIFPLDGEKILYYFLPPNGQNLLLRLRSFGIYILLALVFLNITEFLIFTPALLLLRLFLG